MTSHKIDIQSRILAYIKQHGITQNDLAHHIGVDVFSVGRWARGKNSPRGEKLKLVMAALDVPPKKTAQIPNEQSDPLKQQLDAIWVRLPQSAKHRALAAVMDIEEGILTQDDVRQANLRSAERLASHTEQETAKMRRKGATS